MAQCDNEEQGSETRTQRSWVTLGKSLNDPAPGLS